MKKQSTILLKSCLIILTISLVISGCDSTNSDESPDAVTIGLNFEITGDSPQTGEGSKNAAELFTERINASGGVMINGQSYQFKTVLEDNTYTADGAVAATQKLITEHEVLAMIGPNSSFTAIPSGEVADNSETVLISPLSTNPMTTLDRPYVFRIPFLDSFQGEVLANFAKNQFSTTNACLLFAENNPYSKGLAESFRTEWEMLNGVVTAYEAFTQSDEDLSPQLNAINTADCGFLFLPQFAHEVPAIVEQAHEVGITAPILGGDAWTTQLLLDECGANCEGYFSSKLFVADDATGITKDFVENYEAKFGTIPGDPAALTWEALLLIEQALKNCGSITGDLAADRSCVRDGMASIQDFEGVTGNITFDENGDPQKCVFIVQIVDNEFIHFDTVCPES